jgi:hypothetical protein
VIVPTVERGLRGESLDEVDVGLLHLAEELARIGGEGLHIASLPLRVDRVEGERRLARAGDAGEDDEGVARQLQVDVSQVVLSGPPDNERIRGSHES